MASKADKKSYTDLTQGSMLKTLLAFSVPFLISSFLQTFYGLADLFITGQFNAKEEVSAVATGSQVMHMFTLVIVGIAMGTTVTISRSVGAKKRDDVAAYTGSSVTLFAAFAAVLTAVLLICTDGIVSIMSVPVEAVVPTAWYLRICFCGLPFITAYNVIGSIFRGLGDTRSPVIFVGIAGVINIGLDCLFVGGFGYGAAGAAAATVISQAFSVVFALFFLRKRNADIGLKRSDLKPEKTRLLHILRIGIPIAVQELFIQISFLLITVIANTRGIDVAAAVGVVEKIIGFLFLANSAMLSTVAAVASQNAGAGMHDRGRKALKYGILIVVVIGAVFTVVGQLIPEQIVDLFVTDEPEVVRLGAQYFRTYVPDCICAGIHFCFSGYFSAYGKSMYSFWHNIIAIVFVRVPGAYFASVLYPETLYQMGAFAPLGSIVSVIICVFFYIRLKKSIEQGKTL